MASLVVPGVRVEARFDVLPPLPAPSGIVGAVGIVDRPPARGLLGVTKVSGLRDLLGPGTEVSLPEAVHALANGASEVVVSAVGGTSASAASSTLNNVDSQPTIKLICRSKGAWGNELKVDVRGVGGGTGGSPSRVTLSLLRGGRVVERFPDLRVSPGAPDDLVDTINRGSRYVVAVDTGLEGQDPEPGTYAFAADTLQVPVPRGGSADPLFTLIASGEADPDTLSVTIAVSSSQIAVAVSEAGAVVERFSDLTMNPDDDAYLPRVLEQGSRRIRVRLTASAAGGMPRFTDGPQDFAGGGSPTVDDYRAAIDLLSDDPRIDLVLASIDAPMSDGDRHTIHQALTAHAVRSADAGAPRIAFGSISATEASADTLDPIRAHAAAVRNRRFVLVAPPGAHGAVAGMIGRMSPQFSPTFKPVPLHGLAAARFRDSQLNQLLGSQFNLLVVQERVGRGVVVLRGLDTTGDQVSVTRVADQAIRETKAIAENFIGRLNTDAARNALKQQLVATFLRMERDGALVPSTDGSDPAFLVDVYSTQTDFAQGIVRIDIAVRPVRAIDFIYATIRVKN